MYWFNGDRMRLVVVGIVAAIVLGGGNAKADFTFGEPVNLGPTVNSPDLDFTQCVSADGLELYFGSFRGGGYGTADLWLSTRSTIEENWGDPVNLGPGVNTSDEELGPCLSMDGLELYFQVFGPGGGDIWVARRAARGAPWAEPVNLGPPVNIEADEYNPCLSADGLELYFASGNWDSRDLKLFVARRDTRDAPWGVPVSLGPVVNSWSCQDTPWISSDGLLLVFSDVFGCSPRPGGFGGTDIWFSRRATKESEWGEPVNLGAPVNTSSYEDTPMISADGSTLYFSRDWISDIYQAPIIPIVDLNSDGIVDSADMCIIVDHWGTDESLCDIAPMPWGDGIVNVEDLIVLAEHLFEEVPPVE